MTPYNHVKTAEARSESVASNLQECLESFNNAFVALRLSYIALLPAATFAEEHGDKKAMRFYDKEADRCRKALEGVGVLVPQRHRARAA